MLIIIHSPALPYQESLARMWEQVKGLHDIIAPIAAAATDGINLICFSQGNVATVGIALTVSD